jgi:hypothetical protein
LLGELGAVFAQGVALGGEVVAAGGDRAGAAGELVEVDELGLVGVEKPDSLAVLSVEFAVQALELCGE